MRKRSLGLGGVGALALGWVASCGGGEPRREVTGAVASPIQGGANDTTHDFVVGIVQVQSQTAVELCSGVLLAPNLVATARHCVAMLTSPQIVCGSSSFGALVPASELFVSIEAQIQSMFVNVAPGGILVPSGPGQTAVCGNDIALLILQDDLVLGSNVGGAIDLANYVVPSIDPPMSDPIYATSVTAIGYGIDTPTDDAGLTAGVRRIKENIPLACVPNDATHPALDCFMGAGASGSEQVISASEFISGDASTCEGDSGSAAFDQSYFNQGEWVSFGILSRGSVSSDGQTCIQPIYTRFDAWGSLLIDAAKQAQAASKARYALPLWATGASIDASFPAPPASSSSGSGTTATAGQCSGNATGGQGTACACANDCQSNECVTLDGTNYVCANPCNAGACAIGFTCHGTGTDAYCFPGVPPASTGRSGGCSAAPQGPRDAEGRGSWGSLVGLTLLGLRGARRRQPRAAGPPAT